MTGTPFIDPEPDPHLGLLQEADYGFACWTSCACGWRSQPYRDSVAAFAAHDIHVDLEALGGST
jgi:hypothetical protein